MDLSTTTYHPIAPSPGVAAERRHLAWRWTWLVILLLAALGSGVVLAATRHGAGASPDSVVYIGVARNLLAGRGLTEPFGAELDTPLTRYPPLYPVLLAAGGPVGVDPLVTSRWLAALLAGANVFLAGLALRSLLPFSRWLPLIGSLLVLTGYPLLAMHSMAWSEPLFLLLSFLGLFLLAAHLDRGRTATLVGAGLLIGLAFLTRYAAIPFLAAGVLGLLFMGRRPVVRRLGSAALFTVLAALPTALWTVRNVAVADTAARRDACTSRPSGVSSASESAAGANESGRDAAAGSAGRLAGRRAASMRAHSSGG